nr:unnamed protein product [Callosobruchus chinensis]
MQSREGQFDSSVTGPQLATSRRFLTSATCCWRPLTVLQIFKQILLLRASLYNSAALQACWMHPRNLLFSPPGCRSSYIKNRTIRLHFVRRVSRAWNGLPGGVLVEPASVTYSSLASTNFP